MKYGEKAIKEAELEVWENPCPERDYTVEITFPEFTSLCPRSGYPDFATLKLTYVPGKYIVELRSLKLYLNKYRKEYISYEAAANRIYGDLKKVLKPKKLDLVCDFNPRGNVRTTIQVSSDKEG